MYLKALKSFTYSTRRLQAGDIFEARKPIDARLLIAIKKAREHREPGKIAPPPARLVERLDTKPEPKPEPEPEPQQAEQEPAGDDVNQLRAEYLEKFGKRPFNGWDAPTLLDKIAAG